MKTRRMLLGWLGVPALLAVAAGLCFAEGSKAVTKPSEDRTLSFVAPGRVAKVLVKQGDEVKAGQLLVQQDNEMEQVQAEQLKAQAEDTVRVKAAEETLAQKKVEYEKLKEAYAKGAVSRWDVERARLDVSIYGLSLDLAKFNQEQDRRKYREKQAQIERMKIVCPFDGRVEKIFIEAGESADALTKVIRVVKTDPLWVDVAVPLAVGRTLKLGRTAKVTFAETDDKPAEGKVIDVAGVADAASDTLMVRLLLPNPTHRPAGEHVNVTF
jgi:RND family efflux transporter MFP subunit